MKLEAIDYDPFEVLKEVIKECVPEYAPNRSYTAATQEEALEALKLIKRMVNK